MHERGRREPARQHGQQGPTRQRHADRQPLSEHPASFFRPGGERASIPRDRRGPRSRRRRRDRSSPDRSGKREVSTTCEHMFVKVAGKTGRRGLLGPSHPRRRVLAAPAVAGAETGTVRRRDTEERGMAESEREKALDAALGQIEKQFGKGSVMRMGDNLNMNIESVGTGALSLDLALGIGGLPRGRIVEIYGPESSGKSTLAMHVVAEAQRNGGICAYIDAEHAMDPVYARAIGVNVDDLLISQPDTGEQALEIADMLIRSGALDVLVVDSVAALTPRAEIEGEMGDTHVGLQARLMSQALRKLTGTISKSSTIAIFINQLREKIGVMFGCFHYSTRVVLEDGSTEKIGKIVNQRMPVRVMSLDPETGRISPKRIVEYYNNGRADEFIQFEVAAGGGSGVRRFACTPNHIIFTPDGEVAADELEVGDEVLVAMTEAAL